MDAIFIISLISLAIGLMGIAGSFVFFILGRKQGKENKEILDNINNAIKEWQSKIIASFIEMTESRPEIIAKRSHLLDIKAKHDYVYKLTDKMQYIIDNLLLKENATPQTIIDTLKLLMDQAGNLVTYPPDVLMKIAERQGKTEPEETQHAPSQPKKD